MLFAIKKSQFSFLLLLALLAISSFIRVLGQDYDDDDDYGGGMFGGGGDEYDDEDGGGMSPMGMGRMGGFPGGMPSMGMPAGVSFDGEDGFDPSESFGTDNIEDEYMDDYAAAASSDSDSASGDKERREGSNQKETTRDVLLAADNHDEDNQNSYRL